MNINEIKPRADLSHANLEGRNPRNVDLMGANLGYANLANATLRDCYLTRANIGDLLGANLEGAKMPDEFKGS